MSQVIRNLTPHDIVVYDATTLRFDERSRCYYIDETREPKVIGVIPEEKGTPMPRCQTSIQKSDDFGGFPTTYTEFGEVQNLPEPQENVALVVSAITVNFLKEQGRVRHDIMLPSGSVKDVNNRVIGCTSLGWAFKP